jgi:diaminopimelate epimerase
MALSFHKMHGAGNDFVLIDARGLTFELSPEQAKHIANRHTGIGCDQLLVLRAAGDPAHRVRYEIWNSDGSPAAQCGNGARCVGLYLDLQDGAADGPFTAESPSGVVTMRRCPDREYEVEMGVPEFTPRQVPVTLTPFDGEYRLPSPWGVLEFTAVSMGNPHALLTGIGIDDPAIPEIAAFIDRHEGFPEGCNVGVAELQTRDRIRLRVVERGAGETLACGSGACAAVAVLHRAGRVGDAVEVFLPGGRLVIKWRGKQEPLIMKGPAEHVFRGTLNE